MRISDWSSDVCSFRSAGIGLKIEAQPIFAEPREALRPGVAGRRVGGGIAARGVGVPVDDVADAADAGMLRMACEQGFDAGIVERGAGDDTARQAEIGRAACRDRVCQYG